LHNYHSYIRYDKPFSRKIKLGRGDGGRWGDGEMGDREKLIHNS
jgi:hypothetical protein